jgi:hypothetical protein
MPHEQKAERRLTPAQQAWLDKHKRYFPKPATEAEWAWVARQMYMPDAQRRRATNSVFDHAMAEKARQHLEEDRDA